MGFLGGGVVYDDDDDVICWYWKKTFSIGLLLWRIKGSQDAQF